MSSQQALTSAGSGSMQQEHTAAAEEEQNPVFSAYRIS